jgi:hypothetical protein
MLELPFDPGLVQIDGINTSGPNYGSRLDRDAAKHGLPCLRRFVKHIERRQSRESERFGRGYQRDILSRGGLEVLSPLTGEPVVAVESIAVNGKTFYRFAETEDSGEPVEYFVIASRIRFGFPLAGLLVPKKNWLLRWDGAGKHATGALHLEAFAQAVAAQDRSTQFPHEPVIVMGHTSFAHHLWNELSALETLIHSAALPTSSPILVAREPLGRLEEIFPELRRHTIRRVDPAATLGGVQTGGLFVNLGALCIPETMRRRIVAFSQDKASAAARATICALAATRGPVFWISVRTHNPTLVNQHDVLARIVGHILHEYRHCGIVLDGFSLPEDFSRMPEEMQIAYRCSATETRKESEAIIATVRSRTSPGRDQFLTTIAGMGILDCIAIAQSATAYLCHAGSVQHKIGWTANVPGIIHGNRRLSVDEIVSQHASRLENGIAPLVTPGEFLEDVTGEEPQPNYRSVDPGVFAGFVSEFFHRCLALAPATPNGGTS